MKYQTLKAGDVRQQGDEVIHKYGGSKHGGATETPAGWQPVTLINHTILESDLIVSVFRRPV